MLFLYFHKYSDNGQKHIINDKEPVFASSNRICVITRCLFHDFSPPKNDITLPCNNVLSSLLNPNSHITITEKTSAVTAETTKRKKEVLRIILGRMETTEMISVQVIVGIKTCFKNFIFPVAYPMHDVGFAKRTDKAIDPGLP